MFQSLEIYAYSVGSAFLLYLALYGRYVQAHYRKSLKGHMKDNIADMVPPIYDCPDEVNLLLRLGLVGKYFNYGKSIFLLIFK